MDDKAMKRLYKQFKFLRKKTLPEGIQIEAGWDKIVTDLFQTLNSLPPPFDFVVTKVFNRHGKLQVWTANGCNSTRFAIEAAVEASEVTCEYCGNEIELGLCEKCKYVEPVEVVDTTTATTP